MNLIHGHTLVRYIRVEREEIALAQITKLSRGRYRQVYGLNSESATWK